MTAGGIGDTMSNLPTGTVTFLFTDIEGSTRLLASLGESYGDALSQHRRLLRKAFSSCGGIEVDTQGDAFFYAFARAQDAVTAALAGQSALSSHDFGDGVELKVRMGIHTGEPARSQEGYVGPDVHLGSRICSVAWGGQIVVSAATAAVIAGLKDITLRPLGDHSLKDIEGRISLHQVIGPGLREDFPALRSVGAHPTNLPPAVSPLVGRAEGIADLVSLLASSDSRIVTLTGPGGVGKTRLALATGAELLPSFSDGVFFIDLSALSDPSLVVGAIAAALGLRESPGKTLTETLADYLSSRHTLLVLDNLEHLLDAATDVAALVVFASSLKLLVTSREALRIAGEHEVPLDPLEVPSPDADAPEMLSSPAVELFLARARALRPGFELTADDAASVAHICRRLDGLPLAIELAAARVKVLSPVALATRLETSLSALGQGRRDASTRQRTLRGAIAWSYELLSADEQRLLRRVSIFAGGWSLDAAEVVCDREDLDLDVLNGLSSLVDKSLVRARSDEERFIMLETIRAFGTDELEASGEAEVIRRAHAEYFRALAEEAEPCLTGVDQKQWLDRLEREHDNLRLVLRSMVEASDKTAISFGATLWRFWSYQGHLTEGRRWLDSVLRLRSSDDAAYAKAAYGNGVMAASQGDYGTAQNLLLESETLFAKLGDMDGMASCLARLGWVSSLQGDYEDARRLSHEALTLARQHGRTHSEFTALTTLGHIALQEGNIADARKFFEKTLSLSEEAKDKGGRAIALGNLGAIAIETGDYEGATHLLEQGLIVAREVRDLEGLSTSLINLGLATLFTGRSQDARRYFSEALNSARRMDDKPSIAYSLEGLAGVTALEGNLKQAGLLFGSAAKLRSMIGRPLSDTEQSQYEDLLTKAGARLRAPEWLSNLAKGGAITPEEALAFDGGRE
jgi:predicted ATPase/class 3 adenylate cyclase/Tfp pilus assembly protein PilF